MNMDVIARRVSFRHCAFAAWVCCALANGAAAGDWTQYNGPASNRTSDEALGPIQWPAGSRVASARSESATVANGGSAKGSSEMVARAMAAGFGLELA